eukprot:SAG11_NODE_401_length_9759_cov_119.937992_7_plen_806_part_00
MVAARTREATGKTPVRSVRSRSDSRPEAASGEAVWPPEAAEKGGSRSSDLPAPSEAPAAAPAAALQVQLDEEWSKRAAGRSGRREGPGEQGAALSSRDLRDSQEGEGGIEDWLEAKPDSRVSAAGDDEAENCPGPAVEDAPAVGFRSWMGRQRPKPQPKAAPSAAPGPIEWSYTVSEPPAWTEFGVSAPVVKEAGSQGGTAGAQERALALEAQNAALLLQVAQLQAQVAGAAGTSVPVDIGQVVRQILSPPSGGNTAAQAMPMGSSVGGISAAGGPTTPLSGTGTVADRVAGFQAMQAAAVATDCGGTFTMPAPNQDGAAGGSASLNREGDGQQGEDFGDESFISVYESENRTASVGISPDGPAVPTVGKQLPRTGSVTQRGSVSSTADEQSEAELNFDDSAWGSEESEEERGNGDTVPPLTPAEVSMEALDAFMKELDSEPVTGMGQLQANSEAKPTGDLGADTLEEGSDELDRLAKEAKVEAQIEAELYQKVVSFQRVSILRIQRQAMQGWMQVVRLRWNDCSGVDRRQEPAFGLAKLVRMVLFIQRVRGIYLRHSKCVRDRQGVGTILLGDTQASDCARHCANEAEGGLVMYPDDHYDKCVLKIMGLTAPRALVVLEKIVSPLSVVTTRHFRRLFEARPTASRQHYARAIVRAAVVLQRGYRSRRLEKVELAAEEAERRREVSLKVRLRKLRDSVGERTLRAKAKARNVFLAWAGHLRSVQAEHTRYCLYQGNGWVAARTDHDIKEWGSGRAGRAGRAEREHGAGSSPNLASTYVCILRNQGQNLFLRRMPATAELYDSKDV